MKKTKIVTLLAVAGLSVGVLVACSNNAAKTSSASKTAESSKKADTFTGASQGTTDFDTLQKGLAANGTWLAAITGDVDAAGKTLTVDGEFMAKPTDDDFARELVLGTAGGDHSSSEGHVSTAQFTLTVAKIVANSPHFTLVNGNIKGDVYVNDHGFHVERYKDASGNLVPVTIDGNLKFKTQAYLDAFNKLPEENKPTVTGTVGLQ